MDLFDFWASNLEEHLIDFVCFGLKVFAIILENHYCLKEGLALNLNLVLINLYF
jgi:hypothetical protein